MILTIILITLQRSFSMEPKNTIPKLFYFSHPYLLSYRFTPTKILNKKERILRKGKTISHCITSRSPFFIILHRLVAWFVFCTPLSLISEGSIFSICYFFVVLQPLSLFYSLGRGRGVALPNITSSSIFRGQQLPKLLFTEEEEEEEYVCGREP